MMTTEALRQQQHSLQYQHKTVELRWEKWTKQTSSSTIRPPVAYQKNTTAKKAIEEDILAGASVFDRELTFNHFELRTYRELKLQAVVNGNDVRAQSLWLWGDVDIAADLKRCLQSFELGHPAYYSEEILPFNRTAFEPLALFEAFNEDYRSPEAWDSQFLHSQKVIILSRNSPEIILSGVFPGRCIDIVEVKDQYIIEIKEHMSKYLTNNTTCPRIRYTL